MNARYESLLKEDETIKNKILQLTKINKDLRDSYKELKDN